MAEQLEGARADMELIRDAVDTALGYPVRDGRHVGGGRHFEIHRSIPGPGWTIRHARVRKHPSRELYAYPVTERVLALDGQVVQVRGQDVTIDTSGRVERDGEWDASAARVR